MTASAVLLATGPQGPMLELLYVQVDHGPLMALSGHGVGFPVSEELHAVGRFGPGLEVRPVRNATGAARAAAALSTLLSMTVQV